MTKTLFPNAPDLAHEDYCVFGIATCFVRDEGEVKQVDIVEPIPSAALEALFKDIPTSYKLAYATTLGEIFVDGAIALPAILKDNTQLCEEFATRTAAAARTYKRRTEAQSHIPLGNSHSGFNYSLDRKRVLNQVNVVSTEDNVKQHEYTHKVL